MGEAGHRSRDRAREVVVGKVEVSEFGELPDLRWNASRDSSASRDVEIAKTREEPYVGM